MTAKRALIWAAVSTTPQADEDEKFSIPKQIEDGQLMCTYNDWQVVDTLVVPGHSRDYRTLELLAADARKKNIDAFDRLIKHFRDKDFDVFICRDANRFARKASLLHYIAETIIEDCHALIYSQSDNMFIDEDKLPWWATIQGYKVRAEIKALVDGRHNGMFKRAARGLPTGSGVIASHIVIRDAYGNAIRMEVDEGKRRMWDDVYRLIVYDKIIWAQMEIELAALGHTNIDGTPMRANHIRDLMATPMFWGHSTRFHNKTGSMRRRNWGWVYDPSQPVPAGIVMYRNTHPSVYAGQEAQHIIAELERRNRAKHGSSDPYRSHRYSGLVVCRDCGRCMNYSGHAPELYLGCRTNSPDRKVCSNTKSLLPRVIDAFVSGIQKRLQQGESLLSILALEDNTVQIQRSRTQLKAEIDEATEQSRRLIMKQVSAPANLVKVYDQQIEVVSQKLTVLDQQLAELDNQQVYDYAAQELEAKDFAAMGDGFWQLSDSEINTRLSRVLGHLRLSAYRAEVTGFEDAPKKRTYR